MGRFITLPGVNPSTSRPKVDRVDPMLPESGALFLIDPTHPANPWPSGVPANLSLVPNIARSQALALGVTEVEGIFSNTPYSAGMGLTERTAKGGLHGLATAANIVPDNEGVAISIPHGIGSYLLANPGHNYFISSWMHLTRARTDTGSTTQAPVYAITSTASESANRLMRAYANGVVPTPNRRNYATNEAGPFMFNHAVSAWTGTIPAIASMVRHVFRVGRPVSFSGGSPGSAGQFMSDASVAGGASWAFYRTYIEDLTVSGRSYAEVDALDTAMYTKEVLTAGGRYYGDTFTNPATIA